MEVIPVTFAPGWRRLAASPSATGSDPLAVTMGIVDVARFAAIVVLVVPVTMTSTLRRTSSAASIGSRSLSLRPQRGSKRMFCPST